MNLASTPLSDLVTSYKIKPMAEYQESDLLNSLEEVINYRPLVSEKQKKEETINYLVKEWFAQKIGSKYDEMSPEIFDLKRKIRVDSELFKNGYRNISGKKIICEIPMFATANPDKNENWTTNTSYTEDRDDYKLELSSRIPKMPSEIRKLRNEAISLSFKTYGDAINTDIISDVIFEKPSYAPRPDTAEPLVLWKPRPSEIHVKAELVDNDPALLLKYDRPYLVGMWEEPDEMPFESIVSMFKRSNIEKLPKKGDIF